MTHWMIDDNDPARYEIAERSKKLHVQGNPDKASYHLGAVTLANGKTVEAHMIPAVDAVITDGKEVVMINRLHDPGMGKPALPGGFIDPLKGGGVETAIQASVREALEEAGAHLSKETAVLVGRRNLDRPFDVRVAINDHLEKKYGIKEGDVFMVSTQLVYFDVKDLRKTRLKSGDDAAPGSARRIKISEINKGMMGIPDHFDMIATALMSRTHQTRGRSGLKGKPPRPLRH